MYLNSLTRTRLNRLPKLPVVWEGDRRPIASGLLSAFGYDQAVEADDASDCIIWVDGTEGVLRAVTIVPADTGPEAVARTLIQAMEHPQGAVPPARPHRLVVRDREIQFFLRGALQSLDIAIDHVAELPIIDEIFDSLEQQESTSESDLPPEWLATLGAVAQDIWDVAPWNTLSDHEIIAITLNRWELDTLYVSVLGMAGMEYGLLLYRSAASLKQFREMALLPGRTTQQMQQAFLSQDCLFLNFDLVHEDGDTPVIPLPWMRSAPSEVEPEFGSLHPLEGLRYTLELEEAAALKVGLDCLGQFFQTHAKAMGKAKLPTLRETYTVADPLDHSTITVTVATDPALTLDLEALDEAAADGLPGGPSPMDLPPVQDDYVPQGALLIPVTIDTAMVQNWCGIKWYHGEGFPQVKSPEVPVLFIQTSLPKAKKLVQQIQAAQGITAMCFNRGSDPMTGDQCHLGLLQTGDGIFHLFGEYSDAVPQELNMVRRWQQWQQASGGHCGIAIAKGVTGAARSKPSIREIVAFFETRFYSPEELNLLPLQLTYAIDWE